jgi:hypothetical protein
MNGQGLDSNDDFPPKAFLWPGSLLASIAHAIFVARAPFLAHEQSWDGRNYNVQDSQGSRGTIAYGEDKNCFVGVFFLQTSRRNPLKQGTLDAGEATISVRDVPEQLKELCQGALQYVLQEVAGKTVPVITSAFWSDPTSSGVTASEPWSDVVTHGAVLVKKSGADYGLGDKKMGR